MKDKWGIVATIVAVVLVAIVILSGEPFRYQAVRKARHMFLGTRPGTPGSYDFATRGVEAGMSEEQVDMLLLPGAEVMRHMPDRSETDRWDGFVNVYEYQYGIWRHPILHTEHNLGVETLWVYFDRHGCAQKVLWVFSGLICVYSLDPLPARRYDLVRGNSDASGSGKASATTGEG